MSEEEKKFLEIVDLKKGFGSGQTRQEVLRGMNFSVAKGEFCVLLGPSGSGKSTLLNIIGGIDNADSGYININGDKLEDMSEKKLTQYRRKHLGYVFQMYNLIGNLNVKENIEVGAYLSDNALDIDDLLHTLGLYEHRYKLPNQLSGGQQQRVSIGRAIVKNPDILLCDEPTGALDYNTSKEILKLIEEVNQKYGNTIIMVTTIDEAWAGDIIGLPDNGTFKIGDTLTEGEMLHFKGLPSFSPEMFKYIENADPMKQKQLAKGIDQLMDEGVAQLFVNQFNGRKIIGTVGQLQFEVIQYRLENEYSAKCRWEPLSLYKACWIESDDPAELEAFKKRKYQYMAKDREGRDVFLADSGYVLQMAQMDFKNIKFHFTSEF